MVEVQRVAGQVMAVNSFVVHGPEGAVVVDGMLTVSDAGLVRATIDRAGAPLCGVLLTHPHPDHYAGLSHIVGDDDVPIIATPGVDEVIRRDDALKDSVVGPMMGAEWPSERTFPTRVVESGTTVQLGGLEFSVEELGPGESHMDTLWHLDAATVFAGDVAYSGLDAYLADGQWAAWLASLERLEKRLPDDIVLHVGHGPSGTKALLAGQRRYIEAFLNALDAHEDEVAAGNHRPVLDAMRSFVEQNNLEFLLDLSIDPVRVLRREAEIAAQS